MEVYNPLDKRNIGQNVTDALLEQNAQALTSIDEFKGAGIYALYYKGKFEAYKKLSDANSEEWRVPIYVGKAVPPGSRKGTYELNSSPGRVLFNRLKEHKESIDSVKNLEIRDFACRYLLLDDIWIPLGETLLIIRFEPVWNKVVDGFGIHDPGKRRKQLRSLWDTLHPGRKWAKKLVKNPRTVIDIESEIKEYLDNRL